MVKLPPDPDNMNAERAKWVRYALYEFTRQTGQSIRCDGYEEIISDLLADLAHFCDRHRLSMVKLLSRAKGHYIVETDGEGRQ